MISFVIPTRDRPDELRRTLEALGALDPTALGRLGGAEVVVVDNASDPPARAPTRLANGVEALVVRRSRNEGAAARNVGAARARGSWLVMLDDDSAPTDAGLIDAIAGAAPGVSAIAADIVLPDGSREAGGLPEVFIGCGVAIRRGAFLRLGGYDAAFGYYAEEYDLAARMLLAGWRVAHDPRFRVEHRKVTAGRDMDHILHRLVRNNGWVEQRYAPEGVRERAIEHLIARYGAIAETESARGGYERGLAELRATVRRQPRRPMSDRLYARFTGQGAVRDHLPRALTSVGASRVAIVEQGKNAWAVRRTLEELGVPEVAPRHADALVVGTLSPGPMLDAAERLAGSATVPILTPWRIPGAPDAYHPDHATPVAAPSGHRASRVREGEPRAVGRACA
jgi:GT2 family glycosyltransferase